jgi:hypothetical protein
MRNVPLLLVALLAGLATTPAATHARSIACGSPTVARVATGTATVRWTWGSAEALTTNQDFAGPGVYTQTVSVTGLSGTIGSLELSADVRGDYPAAWSMLFVPPNANCLGHPALSAVPLVAGTEVVPGASVAVGSDMALCIPPVVVLHASVTIDPPFTFDPSKRYGLATLSFDHSASVIGAGDASHCGGAETGLCFVLWPGQAGTPELPALTWQGGGEACTGFVPTRATTWGAVKQIYR